MTAPEVFQVRDGDGWEVYVTNASGGWRLVSSGGGTAVVHTLPDGAVKWPHDSSAFTDGFVKGCRIIEDFASSMLAEQKAVAEWLLAEMTWYRDNARRRMRSAQAARVEGGDCRG